KGGARSVNIIGNRRIWLTCSGILMLIFIGSIIFRGFNLGIDFTGGTTIEVPLPNAVTAPEVEEMLNVPGLEDLNLNSAVIQPFSRLDEGGNTRYGVLIKTRLVDGEFLSDAVVEKTVAQLESQLGISINRESLAVEKVGPVIGADLTRNTIWAIIIATLGILIYVSLRFEFMSGLAGVIALVHDVLFVLGVFSLLGQEVNSNFVAAVLTVIGYSINDTIVIFDRVRENLRARKKGETFDELVNDSVIQTFRRSVNTSVTTILAVMALFLLGGRSLKEFTFAMIIGMVAGSYSTIFIASPLWVVMRNWQEKRAAAKRGAPATR
ncbi:MAG TPA: protein translocase subunit SecF, partial [Firmicutes bacterium]|nr:protein translocase subunit SecF [Bacillota bacterium]